MVHPWAYWPRPAHPWLAWSSWSYEPPHVASARGAHGLIEREPPISQDHDC